VGTAQGSQAHSWYVAATIASAPPALRMPSKCEALMSSAPLSGPTSLGTGLPGAHWLHAASSSAFIAVMSAPYLSGLIWP
jgi:hypothetical protein